MAHVKVLSEFKGSKLGIIDSQDPEKKSIVALKVIDISDFCPKARAQVIIKYAKTTQGPLVQLKDLYKHGEDVGACVHYLLYEDLVKNVDFSKNKVFVDWCRDWDIEPDKLIQIIVENTPKQ